MSLVIPVLRPSYRRLCSTVPKSWKANAADFAMELGRCGSWSANKILFTVCAVLNRVCERLEDCSK